MARRYSTDLVLLTATMMAVAGAVVHMRRLDDFMEVYLRVEEHIGNGSNSEVFSARPIRMSNRIVAVKKVNKDHSSDVEIAFQTRIGAANAIPGIPRLYDLVETDEHYFVVMQLFNGTAPADWHLSPKVALNADLVSIVMRRLFKVAKILTLLHDLRVIHGDLHDENVLVDDHENLIVLDFGSAILLNTTSAFQQAPSRYFDERFGAPERLMNNQVGVLSDSFALGKLAQVFRRKLESAVVDNATAHTLLEPLDHFINKATQTDVADRWSCRTLLHHRGQFGLEADDPLDLEMANGSKNLEYLYEPEQVAAWEKHDVIVGEKKNTAANAILPGYKPKHAVGNCQDSLLGENNRPIPMAGVVV